MSSSPDAQLKPLPHVETMLEGLPHRLQQALEEPLDLDEGGLSIRDVLGDARSACFLLDVHLPHPSLIHTIVWRLAEVEA